MSGSRSIRVFGVLLAALLPVATGLAPATADSGAGDTLRQYADRRAFMLGSIISGLSFNREPQYKTVLAREFNSAIVFVFPKLTQPERGRFEFKGFDVHVRFAQDHNMKVVGVTLVYRNQSSPAWLHFDTKNCGGWSSGELDQILKSQIEAVVTHGGDAVAMWEPIDEPLGRGGGCWEKILGWTR